MFWHKREQAFINGTGENQPTGILHATDGAETGVTAESDSAISYDEIIKLYLSVDKKYRKHGTWLMNDETASGTPYPQRFSRKLSVEGK